MDRSRCQRQAFSLLRMGRREVVDELRGEGSDGRYSWQAWQVPGLLVQNCYNPGGGWSVLFYLLRFGDVLGPREVCV